MRFEIFEAFHSGSSNGVDWEFQSAGWYWRLRARNGRIIADGAEGYASRSNVRRAIRRNFAPMLRDGHLPPIMEVES